MYVPNSGQKLVNLSKRVYWESLIREKLKKLDAIKPVLYIGDMNVAHKEIGKFFYNFYKLIKINDFLNKLLTPI